MKTIKKNIIWIASYPKSGNTWFRIFISNLLSGKDEPVNINSLNEVPIASSRQIFDQYVGVNSSDLTTDEINLYRPMVYRQISDENKKDVFLKVHDAWKLNKNQVSIFPKDRTRKAIYLIRNPFDVAVSYSFHFSVSMQSAVYQLNDSSNSLCNSSTKLCSQLQQNLFSWSEHVTSWIDMSDLPIYTIRFEDMLSKPLSTFRDVLEFLEISVADSLIEKTILKSEFSEVAKQERNYGFKEKPITSKKFFRSGQSTSISDVYNNPFYQALLMKHRPIMQRFGY